MPICSGVIALICRIPIPPVPALLLALESLSMLSLLAHVHRISVHVWHGCTAPALPAGVETPQAMRSKGRHAAIAASSASSEGAGVGGIVGAGVVGIDVGADVGFSVAGANPHGKYGTRVVLLRLLLFVVPCWLLLPAAGVD